MVEKLTDIELTDIQLSDAKPRSLMKDFAFTTQEDDIETALGFLHVCVQGDPRRPAILTYHDIGLNSTTCFQGFFSYAEMQPILKHFCVYHVNAPGQQEGALPLPQVAQGEPYPTMDNLANMLMPVLQFYNLHHVIGFGSGAGANVLARFALMYPEKVDGLVLLNCNSEKSGWTEWAYQKWNTWYLGSGTFTPAVEDYLLWHWFGNMTMMSNYDLCVTYSSYMKSINPQNLAMFVNAYVQRSDLGIVREISALKKDDVRNFKCPVMLVAGDFSPHLQDTVTMNSRTDPANCTWMKFECGGMVLEEAPNKLCDAFRLFLQGMGHAVPSLSKMNLGPNSALLNSGRKTALAAAAYRPNSYEEETTSLLNPAVC